MMLSLILSAIILLAGAFALACIVLTVRECLPGLVRLFRSL